MILVRKGTRFPIFLNNIKSSSDIQLMRKTGPVSSGLCLDEYLETKLIHSGFLSLEPEKSCKLLTLDPSHWSHLGTLKTENWLSPPDFLI